MSRPVIAIDFGGVLSVHSHGASEHFKTDIERRGASRMHICLGVSTR